MIIDFVKSMRWVDFLIYSITDPRALYRSIREKEIEALVLGPVFLLIIAIAGKLASSLLYTQSGFFYYRITYGLIMSVLLYATAIVIAASLMDIYSQLTGNSGSGRGMAAVLLYSFFPMSFILPPTLIFVITGFAPLFFYTLIWLILFVKCSYNAVTGISEMLSISVPKAVTIFIFPAIFIILLGPALVQIMEVF